MDKGGTNQSIKNFLSLGGSNRDLRTANLSINRLTSNETERAILKKYWVLLTQSSYFDDVPYMFLVENYTYDDIIKECSLDRTANSLTNDTYKAVKKLFSILGCDPYVKVKNHEFNNEDERKMVYTMLDSEIRAVGIRDEEFDDLSSNLVMPIINKTDVIQTYDDIDHKVFSKVARNLRMLSKPYVNNIINEIPKEYRIYIMYLLTSGEEALSVTDKANRDYLIKLWWIDDED